MDLSFGLRTYAERHERVKQRMHRLEVDVMLVNLPDNVHYLCSHESIGYYWFQTLVVSPQLPEPVLLTRISEQASVEETSTIRNALYYRMHFDDPIEILARFLREKGVANKVIGVEMQAFNIRPAHWDRMKTLLPDARFKDVSTLILDERLIKSPEEVAYQRNAAQMADHAMRAAFAMLRPGVTEIQIAGTIAKALADVGGEYPGFPPMVMSGPRTTAIHGLPGNRPAVAGDVITMEFAGVCRRYHAALMRTAVIGRPSPRLKDVAACVREGTEAGIDAVRPDVATGAIRHAVDEKLNRLDLARRRVHRVGYSIGLGFPPAWVEAMALEETDPNKLASNMSFTIEPNVSFPEEAFGYKMGDTVLCTPDGGESLSGLDHELFIVD